MSNQERKKWGWGSFAVGLVLAIAFFAAFGAVSSVGLKSAFLAAAMVCLVAGAHGLAVGITGELTTGKWTGLIVGAIGFVAWGIAWLAISCAAAETSCTALKTASGWGAIFSAIAALASLAPELFGDGSASSS